MAVILDEDESKPVQLLPFKDSDLSTKAGSAVESISPRMT